VHSNHQKEKYLKKKAKTGKDNIRRAITSKILSWKIMAVDLPIAILFIFK